MVAGPRVRPGPYGVLLTAVLATVAVQGAAPPGEVQQIAVSVLLGIDLVLAVRIARGHERLVRLAVVLAVAGVAVNLVRSLGGVVGEGEVRGDERARGRCSGRPRSRSVSCGRCASTREVKIEAVSGVLSLYVLIGLLFAFIFGALDHLGGAPFFASGVDRDGLALPVLQLHHADDRRLRRLRRPQRPRPHAVRVRDADRPDLPRHRGLADRQQPRPSARAVARRPRRRAPSRACRPGPRPPGTAHAAAARRGRAEQLRASCRRGLASRRRSRRRTARWRPR